MFAAVTAPLFCVRPAQAYTVTLRQVGSNVVATGHGAFDLTGLTFVGPRQVSGGAVIGPNVPVIQTGPTTLVNFDRYSGFFTGPTSFGSGGIFFPTTCSGDPSE